MVRFHPADYRVVVWCYSRTAHLFIPPCGFCRWGGYRTIGSVPVFANHQGVVLAAEAEAVGEANCYVAVVRFVRDVVQVAFGVGGIEINCGWEDVITDGERAGDQFDGTRSGDEVAHHTFDRTHSNGGGVFSENRLDGSRFDGVVFLSSSAVGGDVVDILGAYAGLFECALHGGDGSASFGVDVGDAVGVCAGAEPDDFGDDVGSTVLGVFKCFEDDHAAAFAEDEAITGEVEGAGCASGVIVAIGKGGETIEPGDAEGMDHAVSASGDHEVGVASSEDLGGFADGLC